VPVIFLCAGTQTERPFPHPSRVKKRGKKREKAGKTLNHSPQFSGDITFIHQIIWHEKEIFIGMGGSGIVGYPVQLYHGRSCCLNRQISLAGLFQMWGKWQTAPQ